ncbi:hypothetical protein [Actinomadura rubteroloni]|uniref:hypothetical protein n=1 Tax=Actinomadura rubteroloni TaxID=1926885 RepID=UPI0011AFE02C|nr:hypothetical protein [Actinomadura rubteroloni]
MDDALGSVRNVAFWKPNVRVHIILDGFDHAENPAAAFKAAYDRGAGDNWFTTEREMKIVGDAVRRGYRTWDSITFYRDGQAVEDFPKPDFSGG